MLSVKDLTKQFGQFTAVNHVSFHIKEGEIVGLLGPNGAGKTTTIQMLLGLITPTSGTIEYFGKPFEEYREESLSKINFASTYAEMQSRITIMQSMRIYARMYGVKQAEDKIIANLRLLEIEHIKDILYWKLSSGQKTRAVLAKALLNRPRLILMDEPTASLDPDIARKVLSLIENLQQKHKVAILYTSHNMAEVEELCDTVLFLNHGKIITRDTPLGLTKRIGESKLSLTFDASKTSVEKYLLEHHMLHRFIRNHRVEVTLSEEDIPKVLFGLKKHNVWVTDIQIHKPSLEDVFLSISKGTYEMA